MKQSTDMRLREFKHTMWVDATEAEWEDACVEWKVRQNECVDVLTLRDISSLSKPRVRRDVTLEDGRTLTKAYVLDVARDPETDGHYIRFCYDDILEKEESK